MGLFRRRNETYNQQMLREAGLDRVRFDEEAPPAPIEPPQSLLKRVGVPDGSGVGPRDWDATVTATAPGLVGDEIRFTTLPEGDVIVEEQQGNGDLSPLADAVEQQIPSPYKATATRQDGDLWGVGAKRIEVTRFPFRDGDRIELTESGAEPELRVDGEPSDAIAPVALERLGERCGTSFYVEANRIDGDFWEVKVSAL